MSEELLTFYRTYLAWLEAGAPEGEPFTRCTGLCSNLYDFYDMGESERYEPVLDEMHEQFYRKDLVMVLPFNSNFGKYTLEAERSRCHLNVDRVNWVKERIAEEIIG
ncbi:hypothetical protein [Escherichia phage phiWec179]|nr:hypothetical protein [Escherichia phage phiWec179]BDU12356.1 hypothetical protein [Escherichia phage phiWec181]BDU12796.1 hypothetical protein [Escherichia phage phiWec186]